MSDGDLDRNENGTWKPGTSGNPRGRPKNVITLAEILRHRLTEPNGPDGSIGAAIAERLIALALGADSTIALAAIRLVFERTEGRAPVAADPPDPDDPRHEMADVTPDQQMAMMDRLTAPGKGDTDDG